MCTNLANYVAPLWFNHHFSIFFLRFWTWGRPHLHPPGPRCGEVLVWQISQPEPPEAIHSEISYGRFFGQPLTFINEEDIWWTGFFVTDLIRDMLGYNVATWRDLTGTLSMVRLISRRESQRCSLIFSRDCCWLLLIRDIEIWWGLKWIYQECEEVKNQPPFFSTGADPHNTGKRWWTESSWQTDAFVQGFPFRHVITRTLVRFWTFFAPGRYSPVVPKV